MRPNKKMHIKDVCADFEMIFNTSEAQTSPNFRNISPSPARYKLKNNQEIASPEISKRNTSGKQVAFLDNNGLDENIYDGVTLQQGHSPLMLSYKRQDKAMKVFKYRTKINRRSILDTSIYILEIEIRTNSSKSKSVEVKTKQENTIVSIPGEETVIETIDEGIVKENTVPFITCNSSVWKNNNKINNFGENQFYKIELDSPKNGTYQEVISPKSITSSRMLLDSAKMLKIDTVQITTQSNNKLLTQGQFNSKAESEIIEDDIEEDGKIPDSSNVPYKIIGQIETRSNTSSTASGLNQYYSKLEKAISRLPPRSFVRSHKVVSLLFIVICIIFTVMFQIQVQKSFELVRKNTIVATWSTLRNFALIGINNLARLTSLYGEGLLSIYRYYAFGIPDAKLSTLSFLNYTQNGLSQTNNLVRTALDETEPSIHIEIYRDLIPVIDKSIVGVTTQYTNIFDLTTMLIVRAIRILETPPSLVDQNNIDINLILDNTLNEHLVASEKLTGIIIADNKWRFDILRNQTLGFSLVCYAIGMYLLGISIYKQISILRERTEVINIFSWIKETKIKEAMKGVQSFQNSLVNTKIDWKNGQSFNSQAKPHNERNEQESKRQVKTIKTHYNTLRSILIQLTVLVAIILVLCPFLYLGVMVKNDGNNIKQEISSIIEINSYLFDLNLVCFTIYEYIEYNGTTRIKNRPIGVEWESSYDRLSSTQDLFQSLFDTYQQSDNEEVKHKASRLLQGNLCEVLQVDDFYCSITKGMLDNGIMGLNSYILLFLRQIKDSFDVSDRSFASKQRVLGTADLVIFETTTIPIMVPAYQYLTQLLQNKVEDYIRQAEKDLKIRFGISIAIYIVIGALILQFLWQAVENEKLRDVRLFRKIPFGVITSSLPLKNYFLKKNSSAI